MLLIETLDFQQTEKFAQALSKYLDIQQVVFLSGDLGAGKTALARGLIRALCGNAALDVPSPTFTLMQNYESLKGQIYHVDLYRLLDEEEVFELGLFDLMADSLLLIEWPERLGTHVKQFSNYPLLRIMIKQQDDKKRLITLEGLTPEHEQALRQNWKG